MSRHRTGHLGARWLGAVIVLLLALHGALAAESVATPPPGAAPRADLLLVASDPASPQAVKLADWIRHSYPVNVTPISPANYQPLVDERSYDGFVYLGQDYRLPPSAGFLADMAQSEKPLLWINYHAWLLDPTYQARQGVEFHDRHDFGFSLVNFYGLHRLAPTDSSDARALGYPARVLYWLDSADLEKAEPGAIMAGNAAFLSYLPSLDSAEADFAAFAAAADHVLSRVRFAPPALQSPEARLGAARADGFRTGFHLPFVAGDSAAATTGYDYGSDRMHANLLRIADTGAEWIGIAQTVFQDGIHDDHPHAIPTATAAPEALANIAQDAHKLGLDVRLTVVVNLTEESRRPNEWRGMIRPDDGAEWWTAYREIVLDAARTARDAGIEALNIGAELNAMQGDAAHWRALIADIRDVARYQGLIGYQVNYNSLNQLDWFDALDYVAIAAYWPLADDRDAGLGEMAATWQQIGRDLDRWRQTHPGVPLEFGEIGYVSQPYSAVLPFSWKPHRGAALDLSEQDTAYQALEAFLRSRPDIAGVMLFASTPSDQVPGDIGYSPFGKPAEAVARRLMTLR